MNLLVDTHIFLWWLSNDPRLSAKTMKLISDNANSINISAASIWEIAIKKAIGQLTVPNNLEKAIYDNGFEPLNIHIAHAEQAGKLPKIHQDPFDRMLIAQAQIEKLTLITHDKLIAKYKVAVILN